MREQTEKSAKSALPPLYQKVLLTLYDTDARTPQPLTTREIIEEVFPDVDDETFPGLVVAVEAIMEDFQEMGFVEYRPSNDSTND